MPNLSTFEPGDRIVMQSGPYKGMTGRRDQYNGGSTALILVRFDGSRSFSLVLAKDMAEREGTKPEPPISPSPSLPVSLSPDLPVSPAPKKRGRPKKVPA